VFSGLVYSVRSPTHEDERVEQQARHNRVYIYQVVVAKVSEQNPEQRAESRAQRAEVGQVVALQVAFERQTLKPGFSLDRL
jgi:hypothetical protein